MLRCYPYSLSHLEYSCRAFNSRTSVWTLHTYLRPKACNIFIMLLSDRSLKTWTSIHEPSPDNKAHYNLCNFFYVVNYVLFWYFQEILLLMEKSNTL